MMHVAWWTRPPLCSLMLCCDLMIDTGKEAFYENEMPKMHSLVLPYFDHGRWTYALFQILKFNFSESILILVSLYINYCIFCRTVNKWNLNNIYRGCVLEANLTCGCFGYFGSRGCNVHTCCVTQDLRACPCYTHVLPRHTPVVPLCFLLIRPFYLNCFSIIS